MESGGGICQIPKMNTIDFQVNQSEHSGWAIFLLEVNFYVFKLTSCF